MFVSAHAHVGVCELHTNIAAMVQLVQLVQLHISESLDT